MEECNFWWSSVYRTIQWHFDPLWNKHSKTKLSSVRLKLLFPFQIHAGTSAPEPPVLTTLSSPVALSLTAVGKTEKPELLDDAYIQTHSSDTLPTISPAQGKSTTKMQAATSVPSGAPTNSSVSPVQTNTAVAPSTTAAAPGESMQESLMVTSSGFVDKALQHWKALGLLRVVPSKGCWDTSVSACSGWSPLIGEILAS